MSRQSGTNSQPRAPKELTIIFDQSVDPRKAASFLATLECVYVELSQGDHLTLSEVLQVRSEKPETEILSPSHRGAQQDNADEDLAPRVLICEECGEEFIFTVAAQQYFKERGFEEDPRRCKACHTHYKKKPRESERDALTEGVRSHTDHER